MTIHATIYKKTRLFAPLAVVLFGLSFMAAPAMAADVEVVFSDFLAGKVDTISAIDKRREKVFRKFRTEGTRSSIPPRAILNRSRFSGTEWGNERVIPDFKDYDLPTLIKAMMDRGIKEADPDFGGKVTVKIEDLKIKDFSLAVINSFSTRMIGDVLIQDADGNPVSEYSISAYLVPSYTATRNYDGPNYAYRAGALNTRIGPIAAEFTQKALKEMYPDYDAPGLIILTQ